MPVRALRASKLCKALTNEFNQEQLWGFAKSCNQPNQPQVCLLINCRVLPQSPSFTEQLLLTFLCAAALKGQRVPQGLQILLLNKVSGLRFFGWFFTFGCGLVEENSIYPN